MSLINDVLKELEQRQAPGAEAAPRPPEPRRKTPKRYFRPWSLWLLAALALGAILQLSLGNRQSTDRSDTPGPLTAQADSQSTLPPLLTSGKAEPVDTSAESPVARVSKNTQEERAEVDPPRERETAQGEPAQGDSPKEDTTAEPEPKPDPEPTAPTKPKPTQPDSGDDPAPSDAASISIRRSDNISVASEPLADAKRLLARGQTQRAESRLRRLIDRRPELTEAHELLARALIRHRRPEAAAEVLQTGLSSAAEPAKLAKVLARLLLDQGELARARSVLLEHAPPLAEAPDYHLLLAAVHRQIGNHEAAAEHYAALGGLLPRRGAVWIGLGASLESLDRPTEAANAYNRALESDDIRAVRFARQRLDALKPLTGEPQ